MFIQICPDSLPQALVLLRGRQVHYVLSPCALALIGVSKAAFCFMKLYQRVTWMESTPSVPQLLLLQITY